MIFGSEGTAAADFERMEEINREIGLTSILHGMAGEHRHASIDEKQAAVKEAGKES